MLHVYSCVQGSQPTLSNVGSECTAVCQNCDWFVCRTGGCDEECMSAALPSFGVACAVFTEDYTDPQLCLILNKVVCV